jgi:hypothetical protein
VAPHHIFSWSSHTSNKISHNVSSFLILALIAQAIMSHCSCRLHSLILRRPLAKTSPYFYNIRCLIHSSHIIEKKFLLFSHTISLKLSSRKRTPHKKHFFFFLFFFKQKKSPHDIFSLSRYFFFSFFFFFSSFSSSFSSFSSPWQVSLDRLNLALIPI